MTITLNGKPHEIPDRDSIPVTELIQSLPIGDQPVLVELNGEAILTREFSNYRAKDGDVVEVIRMVAGG